MSPESESTDPTMSRRNWLGGGAAMLLQGRTGGSAAPLCAPASADTDDDVVRLMRLASVPGMAVASVDGGRVEVRAYGVRRAATTEGEAEDVVTADTVFEAASLSKLVFGYLMMGLERDGVIDLDRPLGAYLALPNPDDARARSITARHLLSHSGGWRNWRTAAEQPLTADFEPGSRFSYSGEGYAFLSRVVEARTGRPWAALVRERVLEPLGMGSSAWIWHPGLDARRASPHSGRGEPVDSYSVWMAGRLRALEGEMEQPLEAWLAADVERAFARLQEARPPFPNFTLPNAAASLMTTARDYGAFLSHLLGEGAPVLARMMQPRVRINEALQWGMGVGLQAMEDGRALFWHWGDNAGFKHFVVGDPAAGSATLVLTNANSGRGLYERIVRARTGSDHPAFLWI